jgi:serine/threonine-protein kinase
VRQLGKYRLLEPVASGGMADVYRAEVAGPEGFVKEVALKVVRGDHAEGSDFVRMFIQEARLASRLNHANIVHVFDFDRVEGRYLIAMEFVHGRTLRAVVERCRERGMRLGLARAVSVAAEVGKALAYAHRPPEAGGAAGLVHRDVSPHNVLVSFEGEVKLADFGIARAMNAAGLTDPGTVKGKLGYMAPEQARGERVDARADLFSLGVVLWELLAGRRLFARDTDAATMAAVLGSDPISPPSAWNEEVPPELEAAVMGLLERDPERRTRTADEVVAALGAVLLRVARSPEELALAPLMRRLWPEQAAAPSARAGEATVVRPPGGTLLRAADGAEADPDASTETVAPPEAGGRPRRAARAVLAAGVAVALASAGLAAWRAIETGRPRGDASPAAGAAGQVLAREEPPAAAAPARPPREAPAPAAEPAVPGEEPGPRLRVAARSDRLRSLPLPGPGSGEGILSLNATPWARVYVEGERIGDTPLELRIPAGRYAVRLVHPTLGAVQRTVEVRPGQRAPWAARLGR